MAEFPALPLFTDAYLADTDHLSDAEHGRYLRLLMLMWRSPGCRIPNDDDWIARRFRRTVAEVTAEIRPLIGEFCDTDGNWITQKRLSRERAYVRASAKRQSDRAKARWEKEKDLSRGNAASGIAPTPTPTPKKEEELPPPPLRESPPLGAARPARKVDVAEWQPDEAAEKIAVDLGLDPERIASDIRDWAANAPPTKRMKSDPLAFWRVWCRKEAEQPRRSGTRRPEQPDTLAFLQQAGKDTVADAIRNSRPNGAGPHLPASGAHLAEAGSHQGERSNGRVDEDIHPRDRRPRADRGRG